MKTPTHFTEGSLIHPTCGDMDRDAPDVVGHDLNLAGVHTNADFDSTPLGSTTDLLCAVAPRIPSR